MNRMRLFSCVWVLAICGLSASTLQAATLRVDIDSAATSPDGSDWNPDPTTGKCYKYLQDAIDDAQAGDSILVAQGTYYPDEGDGLTNNDRDLSFIIQAGLSVQGGYKGVVGYDPVPANSTADDFDPDVYVTVLSGDIDQNDDDMLGLDQTNRLTNSKSVVIVNGGEASVASRLDSVTVRDGEGGTPSTGCTGFPTVTTGAIVKFR